MKLKNISIDFNDIGNLTEFHNLMKKELGLPDFYGNNIHALIDCLSSLRYPEDYMIDISLKEDETLLINLKGLSKCNESIISTFISAIEVVNKREILDNNQISILLCLIDYKLDNDQTR